VIGKGKKKLGKERAFVLSPEIPIERVSFYFFFFFQTAAAFSPPSLRIFFSLFYMIA